LKASDKKLFRKNNSDPYVKCRVASQKYTTKVIENTLNPEWNENFALFIDMLPGATVKFEIFDDDPAVDDSLGKCELNVLEVMHNNNFKQQSLKLEGVKTGTLDVRVGWMKFSDDKKDFKIETENVKEKAALFVTLEEAKDLPVTDTANNTSNSFAEIQVGENKDQTKTIKTSLNPGWQESFFFILDTVDEKTKAKIKILDGEVEDPLGDISFNISSLKAAKDMTVTKSFPLQNSSSNTATISAIFQLKALVPVEDDPLNNYVSGPAQEETLHDHSAPTDPLISS